MCADTLRDKRVESIAGNLCILSDLDQTEIVTV